MPGDQWSTDATITANDWTLNNLRATYDSKLIYSPGILGFNPEINNTKLNISGSCKYILGNNILKVPKFPVCANFFTAKNKKPTFLQGSNFKIAQIVLKPLPMYSSGHKDSEKIYFDISRMYRS